uniref:Peptidase M23B n=1 Tax=Solibacter usitatus (strain Ellin6076) TaxID=234267 RepID=Q026E4_SOLUE
MRARMAAVFALGFAAGMVVLAVALWSTGHLTGYRQEVALAAPATPPTAFTPTPVPAPAGAEPVLPELHVNNEGTLAMPLANLDPRKLESTFHQKRGTHEHEALDIMAPRGTPVMAVAEGNVAKLFTSKQGGLTVYQFDDSRTWCYYYAHLDRYQEGLKEGVLLRKGEVLGYVGSTGDASPDAPHLHFAVFRLGPEKQWWKGTAIDPLPLLK